MNAAAYLLATGQAGATALECGAERLSYGELRDAVGRAAGAWRARGLAQGERVLVFAPDSIPWVIAYLGAIWAGGVAVGLNSRLFERELSIVLAESGARFIWCNEISRAMLQRLLADVADPPQLVIDAQWSADGNGPRFRRGAGTPRLWVYTSGTTGARRYARAAAVLAAPISRATFATRRGIESTPRPSCSSPMRSETACARACAWAPR
jgi:acyl-CoA synthetase (AMP-forming)/AMP-acid ligase II